MTKPKRYQRFSSEFKREATMRANEEGMTDKAVCDELGVSTRQFRRWRDELALLGKEALPEEVEHWSLTTLRKKLVKIGAKAVRHGRYVTFQMAEVAVSRNLFQKILGLIDDLRRKPNPV